MINACQDHPISVETLGAKLPGDVLCVSFIEGLEISPSRCAKPLSALDDSHLDVWAEPDQCLRAST